MILDIFSRFVVSWLSAPRECSELAQQLIADIVARHDVEPARPTLHADRSAAMRSKPVASLLVDLDVAKSHSRPHVSDDNPCSESQFKTMKHRPDFPARFGCLGVDQLLDGRGLDHGEHGAPSEARSSLSAIARSNALQHADHPTLLVTLREHLPRQSEHKRIELRAADRQRPGGQRTRPDEATRYGRRETDCAEQARGEAANR